MEISFTLIGQPARGQRAHPKPSGSTPVLPRIPLVSRLMALAIDIKAGESRMVPFAGSEDAREFR